LKLKSFPDDNKKLPFTTYIAPDHFLTPSTDFSNFIYAHFIHPELNLVYEKKDMSEMWYEVYKYNIPIVIF
jgi:hypothetical protein